jgi:ribonuclease HI
VHKTIGRLGKKIKIHLEWAPGHHELKGNEAADAEAKNAILRTYRIFYRNLYYSA